MIHINSQDFKMFCTMLENNKIYIIIDQKSDVNVNLNVERLYETLYINRKKIIRLK